MFTETLVPINHDVNSEFWKTFARRNARFDAAIFVDTGKKVEDFLTHLAIQEQVAASTQNQTFNAVVLTREEVKQVPVLLEGTSELVVKLLYGCGLRITEAVRNGKGYKDHENAISPVNH